MGCVLSWRLTSQASSTDVRMPRACWQRQSPKVDRASCCMFSRYCPMFGTWTSLGAQTRIISGACFLAWKATRVNTPFVPLAASILIKSSAVVLMRAAAMRC
eukprot:1682739-Amphidinium_carterae.3